MTGILVGGRPHGIQMCETAQSQCRLHLLGDTRPRKLVAPVTVKRGTPYEEQSGRLITRMERARLLGRLACRPRFGVRARRLALRI